MKLYLTIVLLTFLSSVSAQTDSSKTDLQYYPSTKIDSKKLLGIWESPDSTAKQIEFLFQKNAFILADRTIDSRIYGFNRYEFFRFDTSSMVSSNGVIIKWPPDNCSVKLIDENNIQIEYGNFGDTAVLVNYRRKQSKNVW